MRWFIYATLITCVTSLIPAHRSSCNVRRFDIDRVVKSHQSYISNAGESDDDDVLRSSSYKTRRDIFADCFCMMSLATLSFVPRPVRAVEGPADATSIRDGNQQLERIAKNLNKIPMFAIVDPDGIPYTVVGEDAKVTAYFFTTFEEARRILEVARESSDKERKKAEQLLKTKQRKGEKIDLDELKSLKIDPWKGARITTVPLDFAVSLTFKSKPGLYFKLSPADADVIDALDIDGNSELAENLVPLFYFEDFKAGNKDEEFFPLYFRKKELISAFKAKRPDDIVPEIKVTELFSVVRSIADPSNKDPDFEKLMIIPPVESNEKALECKKASGKSDAYQLGKRIVIL